jgi:hypothetical protein
MTQYVELFFTVVGALYTIASAVSTAVPKTRIGLVCAKVALSLRYITARKP